MSVSRGVRWLCLVWVAHEGGGRDKWYDFMLINDEAVNGCWRLPTATVLQRLLFGMS